VINCILAVADDGSQQLGAEKSQRIVIFTIIKYVSQPYLLNVRLLAAKVYKDPTSSPGPSPEILHESWSIFSRDA